jgi:uncharacterized tellurite resistance protein B-like protein
MRQYNPSIRVDQVTEYWTSDHGRRLREVDDPDVATCADCHKVHRIRPPSDPAASTYPLNVPETCGACHSDPQRMTRHGLRTDQLEEYRNSVHGRMIFDEGDLSAPVCNDCHGNHGAAPPGVASIRYVCGQCHAVQGDFFDASRHRTVFEQADLPGCATCHEHHAIQKTSDANLGVRAEQVCSTCHGPGDPNAQVFPAMEGLLDSLTVSAAAARSILLRARDAGMEVSQDLFDLDNVNTDITKARSAIHTFHLDSVKTQVDAGLAVATAGVQQGAAAMEEHSYRRVGLAISAGIILLLIAAIFMKMRDNEARAEEVLGACQAYFEQELRAGDRPLAAGEHLRLAASAALLEASAALSDEERRHLAARVQREYGLPPSAADRLLALVARIRTESVENGRLSALMSEAFTEEQMRVLLEEVWLLVYSDDDLARHEVDLFEALAKLLHVERSELAAARRNVGAYAARSPGGRKGDPS